MIQGLRLSSSFCESDIPVWVDEEAASILHKPSEEGGGSTQEFCSSGVILPIS